MERRNQKSSQERRIYELKVLYQISRIIGSCSDRKKMMEQFLDSFNKIIEYDLTISMLMKGSEPEEMVLQVVKPSSFGFIE